MIPLYQPSGRFSPLVFAYAALAAIAMLAAGFIYQKLISWIPFIYLNFLLALGFAAVGFYAMTWVVKLGKCRNLMIACGLATLVGAAGAACTHYFAYENALGEAVVEIRKEDPSVTEADIRREITFSKYLEIRADEGWSIGRRTSSGSGGLPIAGIFVYLVWLIEAGVIVAGPFLGAKSAGNTPYCERPDCWADKTERVVRLAGQTRDSVAALAAADAVDDLIILPTATTASPNSNYIVYDLQTAPNHSEEAFLTIAQETTSLNKEGKEERKLEVIWPCIILTPAQVLSLREAASQVGSDGRLRNEVVETEEAEGAGSEEPA